MTRPFADIEAEQTEAISSLHQRLQQRDATISGLRRGLQTKTDELIKFSDTAVRRDNRESSTLLSGVMAILRRPTTSTRVMYAQLSALVPPPRHTRQAGQTHQTSQTSRWVPRPNSWVLEEVWSNNKPDGTTWVELVVPSDKKPGSVRSLFYNMDTRHLFLDEPPDDASDVVTIIDFQKRNGVVLGLGLVVARVTSVTSSIAPHEAFVMELVMSHCLSYLDLKDIPNLAATSRSWSQVAKSIGNMYRRTLAHFRPPWHVCATLVQSDVEEDHFTVARLEKLLNVRDDVDCTAMPPPQCGLLRPSRPYSCLMARRPRPTSRSPSRRRRETNAEAISSLQQRLQKRDEAISGLLSTLQTKTDELNKFKDTALKGKLDDVASRTRFSGVKAVLRRPTACTQLSALAAPLPQTRQTTQEVPSRWVPRPASTRFVSKKVWSNTKPDNNTWVELVVHSVQEPGSVYSLFYNVDTRHAQWDEPPTGASEVVTYGDFHRRNGAILGIGCVDALVTSVTSSMPPREAFVMELIMSRCLSYLDLKDFANLAATSRSWCQVAKSIGNICCRTIARFRPPWIEWAELIESEVGEDHFTFACIDALRLNESESFGLYEFEMGMY
eukprot:CAMPEP_0178508902 /NCGR_PEP_ID=MMETSP0696-20121128/21002_1 /TAXON_ID=265572 /ORGANISM="Extubocellulus spinifer, Strain CCMP396" /LENGTH=610 /DNA_ID=CAMNT_0020138491 /DNA_START=168 /DNA_END=2000 /DNA_ORIENTATION=+